MDQQDAEQRIAELDRELAQQKRIAELERQLADARAAVGEADAAQQQIGDADHQVDAGVVGGGSIVDFLLIVGGGNRLLA